MSRTTILLFWLFVLLIITGPNLVRFLRHKSRGFDTVLRVLSSVFVVGRKEWKLFGSDSIFVRTATVNSQAIFFTSLFSMCGKLARADGVVQTSEIEMMEHFIDERLQLSPHRKRMAIEIFRHAKDSIEPFRFFAENFARVFREQGQITQLMYSLLVELAQADGEVRPEEQKLLDEAVALFGLSSRQKYSGDWFREKSGFRKTEREEETRRNEWGEEAGRGSVVGTPFETLGISKGASLKEIKKRYRYLVLECHPDRLVAAGVPEELKRRAEDRFKEIQRAYEEVCRMKEAAA